MDKRPFLVCFSLKFCHDRQRMFKAIVLQANVCYLIRELGTIDGLSTSTITTGEVTTLWLY